MGIVLARLRQASAPWIDGAVFDDGEVGRSRDDVSPVVLRGWFAGFRWTARGLIGAGQGQAEIDLPLRMVNALLKARAATITVARIGYEELVVAPPAALRQAAADRMLEIQAPDQ